MANTIDQVLGHIEHYKEMAREYAEAVAEGRELMGVLFVDMQKALKDLQFELQNNPRGFNLNASHEIIWGFANKTSNVEGHISSNSRWLDGVVENLKTKGEQLADLGYEGEFIREGGKVHGMIYSLVGKVHRGVVEVNLSY